MESIYGIGYDFYQKNGHYLMLHEKQGQQLEEDVLIPLQVRMMESNQIPNLLPLSIEELDFKIRLYYDITSKRKLADYLESHTLSSFEFYQLFINIISTLEQSKLYMLNEHHYILDEDFIFVGKDPQELFLTYLPIESLEKEETTLKELKSLILRVVNEVETLQGSEQKHITQYVEDTSFNLTGLKELLLDLQRLRPTPFNGYQTPHPYQEPIHHAAGPYSADPFQANYQNQPMNGFDQQPNQAIENTEKNATVKKKGFLADLALTQRQKVYVIVIGLLSLTIIWKVYEALPNKGMLYTSGILSLLVVAVVIYLIVKRPQELSLAEAEIAATNQQQEHAQYYGFTGTANNQANPYTGQQNQYYNGVNTNMPQAVANPYPVQDAQQNPYNQTIEQQMPIQQTVPVKIEKSQSISEPEPISTFSLDTNLLVENDDTVLLEDEEFEDTYPQTIVEPYLEIERDGESEKITLSENHFTIGRNESAVNYAEDSVGVSRIHLEFIKIENSYGVKDLGSRNGSKLNGESLVPYKIYALNQDDIISIGKVDYQFKWE